MILLMPALLVMLGAGYRPTLRFHRVVIA